MAAGRLHPPALHALPQKPLIQAGGANQSVDDSGQCGDLAEAESEQRSHEIEPGDGDQSPVQRPDNDEDRRNASQVPGVSKLPVLGRLFKSTEDNLTKTEIVLLMTPRVVRNIERPSARIEHFNSGTDAEVGGAGVALPQIPSQPTPPAPVPSQTPQAVPALPLAAGPHPKPQQ